MITIRIGLELALLLPFWVAGIGWLSGRILGVRLDASQAGARTIQHDFPLGEVGAH